MIKNGIDNIEQLKILEGKRLGLITNQTGVNARLEHTADILAKNFKLAALYGPEHGIRGDKQAGVKTDNAGDSQGKLPVFSLYGTTTRLTDEMLEGIDMMVYDIQDVGARFYTYTSTMAYALEDCARRNIPFVVLDRLNPLGCSVCEGFTMRSELDCFVGGYGLTSRYAMTPGMLALYIKEKLSLKGQLHIVPCLGLDAKAMFPSAGLCWVMPSPNMPTFESALAYIGTCIFEGTNLSEGRGTTRPFEIIGAPFLDAAALARTMNNHKLPGVIFRENHFIPTFSKFAGELCHGVQLHICDYEAFRPFKTGALLFQEICRQSTELKFNLPHFDRIAGCTLLRDNATDIAPLLQQAEEEAAQFMNETETFRSRLYG
ncbi:MAG: DUF1343 domain-containing protein [Victivallales bacterium]|nr:DUF1343 domain-containing protein [Victivallales bacterium]